MTSSNIFRSKRCHVVFHNYQSRVYYAGDYVTGRILLTMPSDTEYEEVLIRVKGAAICRWIEDTPHQKMMYASSQEYIDSKIVLAKRTDRMPLLPQGMQNFNFGFRIPEHAPSSFDGDKGKINYFIDVVILQSSLRVFSKFRFEFNVRADVNLATLSMTPTTHIFQNPFYMAFLNQGVFNITIDLARNGFLPGQSVDMRCCLRNQSRVEVVKIKMTLVQINTFYSNKPFRTERTQTIKHVVHEYAGVARNTIRNLRIDNFRLPSTLTTSTVNTCNIIVVSYYIKVKIVMPRFCKDISFDFPITIGSNRPRSTFYTMPQYVNRPPSAFRLQFPRQILSAINEYDSWELSGCRLLD